MARGGDSKYEMYERAEALASEVYGCGFYELPAEQRSALWLEAEEDYNDHVAALADLLRDQQQEREVMS